MAVSTKLSGDPAEARNSAITISKAIKPLQIKWVFQSPRKERFCTPRAPSAKKICALLRTHLQQLWRFKQDITFDALA